MRAPNERLRLSIVSALVAVLIQATLPAATAFVRALTDLSAADREAMERARREVLDTLTPGALSVWKDDKTGHSGEARLLRTYERDGMPCAEIEHVLRIGDPSRFVMPFCRIGDGTWRTAF